MGGRAEVGPTHGGPGIHGSGHGRESEVADLHSPEAGWARGAGCGRECAGGRWRRAGHGGGGSATECAAHHVYILPRARAGVGPHAVDVAMGGGNIDVVPRGEGVATGYADA